MKSRVALIATLIVLSILIALTVFALNARVDERNDVIRHELELTNTLAWGYMRPYDKDDNTEALRKFLTERGIRYLVTDENGEVVIKSHDDMALDADDKHYALIHRMEPYEDSKGGVYSACVLNDKGIYIKLSADKAHLGDIITSQVSTILICVFLIIVYAYFIMLIALTIRRRRAIDHVMEVLDSFSEGHFDARISAHQGFDKQTVAEYNAILDRMDERVFKQRISNQALSTVMNQMQNGVLAVDEKLNIIIITPVAKQLLGLKGNFVGMPITEASKDVRMDKLLLDAMKQEGVYTSEVAVPNDIGRSHRPLRLYVSAMRKAENVVGAIALIEDITEIRNLEKMRNDFASNVSHELKTPITSIRGHGETMLMGNVDNPEKIKHFGEMIFEDSERLLRLVNDICTISKIENGDTEVEVERICLDQKAVSVIERLQIQARQKNVTVSINTNPKHIYIMAGKDRTDQLLINLIENAIKYNNEGGKVMVQVFADDTNAYLTVADTGVGIKEEHIPRLFERFYRVDKGRSRAIGGTGLGLAIVKHIVISMGGDIEVHSVYGEGTEFCVNIPLAPDQAEHEIVDFDFWEE